MSGIWETKADLAAAFLTWGAYAYGAREEGENNERIVRAASPPSKRWCTTRTIASTTCSTATTIISSRAA